MSRPLNSQQVSGTTVDSVVAVLYPIRILSEKTGVGTSTLRAWERRYGLLKPQRTPKGHRLYSEADFKSVARVVAWLEDGHSLPEIALRLSVGRRSGELDALAGSWDAATDRGREAHTVWDKYVSDTINAVLDFSVERVESIYNEASSLYPVDLVTDRLIQPVLFELGKIWESRPRSGIAEEHFYSSWLKNRLGARFHHAYSSARGARVLFACVPGCFHETGLMLFALSALARGYRALYFGANLPFDQLHHVVRHAAVKAVVLSVQGKPGGPDNDMAAEIRSLGVPVFIGGVGDSVDIAETEQAGGVLLGSSIAVAMRILEQRVPVGPSSA